MMLQGPFGATIPYGIGADQSDTSAPIASLDHALIPFRKRSRYLRLVSTMSQALDYAAGGFHVSVARGLSGGCGDRASGFASGGTVLATCTSPLRRVNSRLAWALAADAYLSAFVMGSSGGGLSGVKAEIKRANILAGRAYDTEKNPSGPLIDQDQGGGTVVAPPPPKVPGADPEPPCIPRDPVTGDIEPTSPTGFDFGNVWAAGIGFFAAAGLTYVAMKYGKKAKGRRRR